VAARIREAYNRPAILCSLNPGNLWKGSGRSVEGWDMGRHFHAAAVEGLITEGGGHEMAGGLSFREETRERLHEFLNRSCQLTEDRLVPVADVVAPASILQPKQWAQAFEGLAPFGRGNPCPGLYVEAAELLHVTQLSGKGGRVPPSQAKAAGLPPEQPEQWKWTDSSIEPGARDMARRDGSSVWAYEGRFRDVITGKDFLARWYDPEAAELTWHVDEFLEARWSGKPFRLPHLLRLQFQVVAYVPSNQLGKIERGRRCKWLYRFEIVQCIEVDREGDNRMPVALWRNRNGHSDTAGGLGTSHRPEGAPARRRHTRQGSGREQPELALCWPRLPRCGCLVLCVQHEGPRRHGLRLTRIDGKEYRLGWGHD